MSKCVDDDFWPMLKFPPINLYSFPKRSLIVYTILSKPNCPQCQQPELMAKAKGVEYEKHARRAQTSSRSQQTKRLQDVRVKEALQELKEQNFHQRNKESIV